MKFSKSKKTATTELNETELQIHEDQKQFNLSKVLYFIGALIVFCSLVLFLGNSYLESKNMSFFLISFAYFVSFYALGIFLWKKKKEYLGGTFLFLALSLVPFVTYTLQKALGWWPGSDPGIYDDFYFFIKGGWVFMEIVTLTFTLITLRFFRYPLLTTVLYVTLWFMSLDIVPFFLNSGFKNLSIFSIQVWMTVLAGAGMMILGYFMDRKSLSKFAFWAFLFGVPVFWLGITSIRKITELGHFFYCLLNVALIFAGPILNRKILPIFGTLGILLYLWKVFIRCFYGLTSFPIFLSFVGIGIIALGVLYHKYKQSIRNLITKRLQPIKK